MPAGLQLEPAPRFVPGAPFAVCEALWDARKPIKVLVPGLQISTRGLCNLSIRIPREHASLQLDAVDVDKTWFAPAGGFMPNTCYVVTLATFKHEPVQANLTWIIFTKPSEVE
jgi:hypothetical protein